MQACFADAALDGLLVWEQAWLLVWLPAWLRAGVGERGVSQGGAEALVCFRAAVLEPASLQGEARCLAVLALGEFPVWPGAGLLDVQVQALPQDVPLDLLPGELLRAGLPGGAVHLPDDFSEQPGESLERGECLCLLESLWFRRRLPVGRG